MSLRKRGQKLRAKAAGQRPPRRPDDDSSPATKAAKLRTPPRPPPKRAPARQRTPIVEGPAAKKAPPEDPNRVSGLEETEFSKEIPGAARPPPPPVRSEVPTPSVPAPVREPTLDISLQLEESEEPSNASGQSEIGSKLVEYESQLQIIESGPMSPERKVAEAEQLQRIARDLFEAKRLETGHSREELQRLNDWIGELDGKLRQLKTMQEFDQRKARAAENAPAVQESEGAIETPPSPTQMSIPKQSIPQQAVNATPASETEPGLFKRFITSPATWAVTTVSAFTGLLFQQEAFGDIANFVGMITKKTPSVPNTKIAYLATVVAGLAITAIVSGIRGLKAHEREKKANRGEGPTE